MPKDEPFLCSDHCSIENPQIKNWYSSVAVNAARASYPGNERALHVLLGPGETIYVPFGMIHSVLNMEDSIAITKNYGSPGNLIGVWKEILDDWWRNDDSYWRTLYYKTMTSEQRRTIRESDYWPPEHGRDLIEQEAPRTAAVDEDTETTEDENDSDSDDDNSNLGDDSSDDDEDN